MGDIPEDVMHQNDLSGDEADTLAASILGEHCACYAEAWPGHICANEAAEVAKKIRAAILAERERCAKIADDLSATKALEKNQSNAG